MSALELSLLAALGLTLAGLSLLSAYAERLRRKIRPRDPRPEMDPIYAVDWAIGHEEDHYDRLAFLENWRTGDLYEEWQDYVDWARARARAENRK